jgi:predicted nucleotidyltransferase
MDVGMRTLDQVQLSARDRRAIEAAVPALRDQFPVDHIVLFGSKARGDDTPESDLDLLVLVHGPVDSQLKRRIRRALYEISHALGVWFGTLVVESRAWQEGVYRVLPIRQEIERDGVRT